MAKKVLIAEDEAIIALSLRKKVEKSGFLVLRITKTGKDTVKSAIEENPDLLIIDINLEDDLDGIDAVMEIHKTKYIPVIYTTASSDSTTFNKANKTKMLKYLHKPYYERELIEAIYSIA